MKKTLLFLTLAAAALGAGCKSDAEVASRNLSKAADQFEINRRVIFYNGITGDYMLVIEGFCSIFEDRGGGESRALVGERQSGTGAPSQLEVTCKTEGGYKKHFLGLSDNVTYFAEQVSAAKVSAHHYRVLFKPQVIVPDIDAVGSGDALLQAITPDKGVAQ